MNSSFRIAFWALSVALGLPLALYIGAALLPIERSPLVAWHARNPHWGLHRDDSAEDSSPVQPARIGTPGADQATPYLIAELGSPESTNGSEDNSDEIDNTTIEPHHAPAIRVAAVPSDAPPAATPPLRRTHRARVSLTAKERSVPAREKRGVELQAPDEGSSPDIPAAGESLPEPEPSGTPVSDRVTSGPQLGDSGVSTESSSSMPARRSLAVERRPADFRAKTDSPAEAAANEALKQEKARLEARLASLQQHIDQLTLAQLSQSREQHQLEQLQQAAQLVQQLQQQSSVNALERQVKALQTALAEIQKAPSKPAAQAPVSSPARTKPPAPATAKTVPEAFPESSTAVPVAATPETTTQSQPHPVAKLYQPQHIGARDLQPLVARLLTPRTGRLSVSVVTSDDVPGPDAPPQREGLLVFDLPEALKKVDKVVAEMDVPPRHVAIEATIFSVPLGDNSQNRVNLNVLCNEKTVTGFNTEAGHGSDNCVTSPETPSQPGFKWKHLRSNVDQLEKSLGQLGGTQLAAHPRVVVVNRQQVCLTIGRSPALQSLKGLAPPENRSAQTGTRLHVRPLIAANGLIRLEIQPESANTKLKEKMPQANSGDAAAQVIITSGQSIVLAGLVEEQSEESSQDGNIVSNELVVLITAKVVQDPAAVPTTAKHAEPTPITKVVAAESRETGSSLPARPAQKASVTVPQNKSAPSLVSATDTAKKAAPAKTADSSSTGQVEEPLSLEQDLNAFLTESANRRPSPAPVKSPGSAAPLQPVPTQLEKRSSSQASPSEKSSSGRISQPQISERVTFLPMPAEFGEDVSARSIDSAPQPAKPGVIPVSNKHPYGRESLKLAPEELPFLSEPDEENRR